MSRFRIAALGILGAGASLTAVPPSSLVAQAGVGGQVELGSYGVVTTYDGASVGLDTRIGAGGRLGLFLNRFLSLEANGDYTVTDSIGSGTEVNVARVGGTLVANLPVASWNALYLGAGYERLFYRGGIEEDDQGAHVFLGDRLSLGGRAALRVEGRAAYYPESPLQTADDRVLNIGGAIGLSVFAFGGPPRDQDGDLVRDKKDRCPDTPPGALVRDDGCPMDGDADGVLDGLDSCPGTPAGAFVDSRGCPSDADGDGVVDGLDVCPSTAAGAGVDANGCPLDADQDGVFDGLDRCPDTPAQAQVDGDGCPQDDDADGVYNGIDRCPGTPRGQQIDEVGCPVLFRVERGKTQPLILRGVNFETGRSRLTAESYAMLDRVAESLVAHPEVRIEVAGHTDATGSRALNMRLSRERALAVMAYLAQRGVSPSRMTARGYGPDSPIASNRTAAGRADNRRVELQRIGDDGQ